MNYSIISWNVNGVRAIEKKGFLDWFSDLNPDILALQETKAHSNQLNEELKNPPGYHSFWNAAEKKGYSGVACYAKQEPLTVYYGLGNERFDTEGRTLILEYPAFYFFNIYFPNGNMSPERLQFKLDFYHEFLDTINRFSSKGKTIIVCGDVNTAHTEIDLSRPKENSTVSGFLPKERAWIDRFLASGLVDTFRVFDKEAGNYTWWDYKTRARERNIGWRIDYFFIDRSSLPHLKNAIIMPEVHGSDHCPIGITVDF